MIGQHHNFVKGAPPHPIAPHEHFDNSLNSHRVALAECETVLNDLAQPGR